MTAKLLKIDRNYEQQNKHSLDLRQLWRWWNWKTDKESENERARANLPQEDKRWAQDDGGEVKEKM